MSRDLPSCVAVVGLGYVGLPLASAFAKVMPTIGFDVDRRRILEILDGKDRNGSVQEDGLRESYLELSDDPSCLGRAPFIIVAVPTPVDRAKQPDLSHLLEASRLIGQNMCAGTTVVYESTVFPGCTEEVCVPILERESGLKVGHEWKVGYSPERVNPGDEEHTLERVVKVVSGQDEATCDLIASVYGLVVQAGIHRAPDIRTAEAAKVIENIQRDLNIAFMNELAVLFHRLGLDTKEVLKAARTKWNFLPFECGLVGGHCISVDPYYLTHKAQEVGYHPEVILAGRRINDSMGLFVARETVKLLIQAGKVVRGAKVLVLGVAFKEDVPDARNTRVAELVHELSGHGINVSVYDPLVDEAELKRLELKGIHDPFAASRVYDAVVLAIPHRTFRERPVDAYVKLLRNGGKPGVLVDVKGALPKQNGDASILYWTL